MRRCRGDLASTARVPPPPSNEELCPALRTTVTGVCLSLCAGARWGADGAGGCDGSGHWWCKRRAIMVEMLYLYQHQQHDVVQAFIAKVDAQLSCCAKCISCYHQGKRELRRRYVVRLPLCHLPSPSFLAAAPWLWCP